MPRLDTLSRLVTLSSLVHGGPISESVLVHSSRWESEKLRLITERSATVAMFQGVTLFHTSAHLYLQTHFCGVESLLHLCDLENHCCMASHHWFGSKQCQTRHCHHDFNTSNNTGGTINACIWQCEAHHTTKAHPSHTTFSVQFFNHCKAHKSRNMSLLQYLSPISPQFHALGMEIFPSACLATSSVCCSVQFSNIMLINSRS